MAGDADLEDLLDEALRQARLRQTRRRVHPNLSHIDYARRLAERGLYRRLAREANASMDALRFEWWFSHSGSNGMTLDQWRLFIDAQIQKSQVHPKITTETSPSAPPAAG